MTETKKIYRYQESFGRFGNLSGIFLATDKEIQMLFRVGTISFGEVLGKHSEIDGNMSESTITMMCDNQEFIKLFEEYDLCSGYNPISYLRLGLEEGYYDDLFEYDPLEGYLQSSTYEGAGTDVSDYAPLEEDDEYLRLLEDPNNLPQLIEDAKRVLEYLKIGEPPDTEEPT